MSFIGINFDQLSQNITQLLTQAATLPEGAEVRRVEGAKQEHAQSAYRSKLVLVAQQLSAELEKVRKFVEENASAFEKAAQSMQETEGADSLAARQADAFVQGIVAPPTSAAGGAPSTSPSTTSPSPSTGGNGQGSW